jgi:hypothetical protein
VDAGNDVQKKLNTGTPYGRLSITEKKVYQQARRFRRKGTEKSLNVPVPEGKTLQQIKNSIKKPTIAELRKKRMAELQKVTDCDQKKESKFNSSSVIKEFEAAECVFPVVFANEKDGTWDSMNATAIGNNLVTLAHLLTDEAIEKISAPDYKNDIFVTLFISENKTEDVPVIRVDKKRDLCLLRKPNSVAIRSPFKLAKNDGKSMSGLMPSWRCENDEFKLYFASGDFLDEKHQISTEDGCCGSPILGPDGILGLHVSGGSQYNKMILVSDIQDFCNSATGKSPIQ